MDSKTLTTREADVCRAADALEAAQRAYRANTHRASYLTDASHEAAFAEHEPAYGRRFAGVESVIPIQPRLVHALGIIARGTGDVGKAESAVAAVAQHDECACVIECVVEDRRLGGDGRRACAHRILDLGRDICVILTSRRRRSRAPGR